MAPEHFDVIVLGAGISGIGAAWHLKYGSQSSFVVLEKRESFGGTWDLFKYPGIRSDSDMYTFGYEHRPWESDKPIAERSEILSYLSKTIQDGGLEQHIRFDENVLSASWDSAEALWTLTNQRGKTYTCSFLFGCLGYYEHDEPHRPHFEGSDIFQKAGGHIVHPQQWSEELDVTNKRVAVIGSGATAVTIVPTLAKRGASVTMVQRSPTYIVPMPNSDPIAKAALEEGLTPAEMHQRVRESKAEEQENLRKSGENLTDEERNKFFRRLMRKALPRKYMADDEFNKHFTPRYNVFQQRLCVAPDADFFVALRQKQASVVTGEIDCFDERGIVMKDGTKVDCDIIVTATGFTLHRNMPMGRMQVVVDGNLYKAPDHAMFKDCMLTDVPNFMFCKGYFYISWTMKVDLICKHLCRLLQYMQTNNIRTVTPREPAEGIGTPEEGSLTITSGFILRSLSLFTRYGRAAPWTPMVDYSVDKKVLLEDPLEHDCLEMSLRSEATAAAATTKTTTTNIGMGSPLTSQPLRSRI
eukprot:CAMPEP_0206441126 /NCGR_PEP_ID=MMETSP0324_2-20121206/13112_1 /ASSEMBLY_ACC=CAM_ASM_000836 /TAXON_ID=2866 /ORGANISM="Crypthecodinium cohnii, Strain Seligo" /LENGTH=525 /DNA_ID=CAMNT_0053908861 /DNA_START=68 /DNA_END=1645 /DNA_ORIENTATION=-